MPNFNLSNNWNKIAIPVIVVLLAALLAGGYRTWEKGHAASIVEEIQRRDMFYPYSEGLVMGEAVGNMSKRMDGMNAKLDRIESLLMERLPQKPR